MTKRMTFPPLTGGLDLARLDAGQMEPRRSPEMKNLWWEDGMLRSRPGQVRLLEGAGQGRAAYGEDFHGWGFFHIGEGLYCADLAQPAYILLRSGLGTAAGTFFRYGEHLYYKTAGHFLRIRYVEEGSPPFAAAELAEEAYVPTILMNAHPATGAGDLYEQENRLTGKLRVLFTPDGETSCYRLPLTALAAVEEVSVNGAAAEHTADLAAGTVTFAAAPEGEANSVAITFRRSNPAAYDAVMTCRAAAVCLSGTEVCMVLGGSAAQPNAVFWNGNGGGGMQDTYFPMACYNLCGDSAEAVTGFGRQYDQLMVLKSGSIGRLTPTLETLEGKTVLALTYEGVHSGIGCDLPRTIALVENNLVFCNARLGVQRLLSASAAYENNLQCISAPVHGGADRSGLLSALAAGETAQVTADGVNLSLGLCHLHRRRPCVVFVYQHRRGGISPLGRERIPSGAGRQSERLFPHPFGLRGRHREGLPLPRPVPWRIPMHEGCDGGAADAPLRGGQRHHAGL